MVATRAPRQDYVILTVILTAALILRLIDLNSPLWHDEIVTIVKFVRSPTFETISNYSLNNHLFYSLQAKAAVSIFGEHNWSVRLPAVAFGIASIAAMWWLARGVASANQAHVTSALMALSYHHVWFSQNARGYTGLMFWCALATILFIKGIRRPDWPVWTAFGLVMCAGLFTHLTAGFFFAALAIIYVGLLLGRYTGSGKLPENLKAPAGLSLQMRPIAGFALGGVLTAAIYAPAFVQTLETIMAVQSTSQVDVMTEYQNPIWTAIEGIRTLASGNLMITAAVPIALLLSGIGMIAVGRREPIAPLSLVVHIPLTIALLLALSMRIWPRFFFVDIAFVLLFMTSGVFVICRLISDRFANGLSVLSRPDRLFALASVLMLALSAVLVARNYQLPKQNLEGALDFVEAQRVEGDAVASMGWASLAYTQYYKPDWGVIETKQDFDRFVSGSSRTWIVFAFPARTTRKYAHIMQDIEADFDLVRTLRGTLGDGNVLVYRSRRSPTEESRDAETFKAPPGQTVQTATPRSDQRKTKDRAFSRSLDKTIIEPKG